MRTLWRTTRSFPPVVRVLMVNQFAINLAFYMLMPYLAAHLAGPLGLAAWAVGLVLGVRNFSQQGMFLIGGTLADRYGYKALIMAGCLIRTAGFALLGVAESLPALVVASAATGFAGALFNPAVRAYLAAASGERRVEAFAAFNVYYQAGMLLGPLVGLALLAADFRLVCAAAATVFAALSVLQARFLPARQSDRDGREEGVLRQWRIVAGNTPFVRFAAAMVGSYVLTFQVYLTLPLAASAALGGGGNGGVGDGVSGGGSHSGSAGAMVTTALFTVSAAVAVVGQLRLTGLAKRRCTPSQAVTLGLAMLGAAFVPLGFAPPDSPAAVVAALFVAVTLLAVGSAVAYPFEMDTVVALARGRFVATHYGLYNTMSGIGITVGNLACGALWDWAMSRDALWVVWATLAATGAGCALAVRALARNGQLPPPPPPPPVHDAAKAEAATG